MPEADDAAAAIELAEACRTLLADAAAERGGVRVADAGDELVTAFGLGAAMDDDAGAAAAAMQTALEMAALIEGLNAERTAAGRPPVGLAIGIALGEVVAGRGGRPGEPRAVCLGAALGEARALSQRAEHHGRAIVVDPELASAVQDMVRTEVLEPDRVHGVFFG